MATMNPNETAKIIRDLLRIAKVAMPADLYAKDPRVVVGLVAVKELERGPAGSRPPNVTSRLKSLDVSSLSRASAVEVSTEGVRFVTTLPWDVTDALVESRDDELVPFDIANVVTFVLRDWLISHGRMQAAPKESH